MTKFEWERQLKKGICGLTKTEQQRVLDYYEELFSDKIDAGMDEQDIIAEFGNPYDVANKILVDFYNDGKNNPEADEYIYSDAEKIVDDFDAERKDKSAPSNSRPQNKSDNQTSTKSINGLITLLCVLLFFVVGACFGKWHPAWTVFLLLPVATSLVDAIEKKNWKIFCYPVFVVFLYLLLGFCGHLWHPMWVLFITIPVYYALGDYIFKNANNENLHNQTQSNSNNTGSSVNDTKDSKERNDRHNKRQEQHNNNKGAASVIAGVLLTCVLVWLMIVVWSVVIGLFVAGIGMIAGGVVALISSFGVLFLDFSAAVSVLGVALIVLGLGLVFTFGMASLFKLCVKMCKQFANTIRYCFSAKE